MALSPMNLTVTPAINYTATLPTTATPGVTNSGQITTLGAQLQSSIINTLAGGADELYVLGSSIAASGTLTINLKNFTDAANQTAVSLARIKYFGIWLLGANQTVGNLAGNACSSVLINGSGASNPCSLNMGGTNPSQTVTNAGKYEMLDGSAAGLAVSSGTENVLITNNDSVNAAKVVIVFSGGST